MLFLQGLSLWARPHFQFFPVAWLAYAYFAGTYCSLRDCRSWPRVCVAWLAGIVCVAAAYEAIIYWSPWLSQFAAILLVVAWSSLRLGRASFPLVLGLSSLLWITLPFPVGYDQKLISFLQSQSSLAASVVLDCLGVIHLRDGNILELTSKRLFVDEACSGVDSLYALMTLCLGVAIWFRLNARAAILSLALVPFWASCSNLLRLTAIAIGIDWFAIDLSVGNPHTILGMVVFVAAFAADFSFLQFAGYLFGSNAGNDPAEADPASTSATGSQNASLLPSKARFAAVGIYAFALIAIGGYSMFALATRTIHRLPRFDEEMLAQLSEKSQLPKQIGNARLQGFHVEERNRDSAFGQYSHIWEYGGYGGQLTISADFPFRGFHPLNVCYQGAGWTACAPLDRFEMKGISDADSSSAFVHSTEFVNAEGNHAFLMFAMFQLDGSPVKSEGQGIRGLERLEQTILEPVTYQVQALFRSSTPLTPEARSEIEGALRVAIPTVRKSFLQLESK